MKTSSKTTVTDVLQRYGLTAYEYLNVPTPIHLFEDDKEIGTFLIFMTRLNKSVTDPKKREYLIEKWIRQEVFYNHFVRITDVLKWKQVYNLTTTDHLLPDSYLTKVYLYENDPLPTKMQFKVSFQDVDDLANQVEQTVDEVRTTLHKPFKMRSLFQLEQARIQADQELDHRIEALTEVMNAPATARMLKEIAECLLELIHTNPKNNWKTK